MSTCTIAIMHVCPSVHTQSVCDILFGLLDSASNQTLLFRKLIFLGCIKWEALAGSWGVSHGINTPGPSPVSPQRLAAAGFLH